MEQSWKFIRLHDMQKTEAARIHDLVATAFERAFIGLPKNPETVQRVVSGAATLLITLCLESKIDPLSVFSPGLVEVVIAPMMRKSET